MHFTWPSRKTIDDRDTNHATGTANPPVGTANAGMFMQVLGTLRYWNAPHASVFQQYTNLVNTATSGHGADEPWEQFLFWDPAGATQPLNTLPLSYVATGLNAVAARSDWTTGASWMSFRAGPYVNNPSQGEEIFDQGSLALVRGNTPLLVNGTGQIVHEPKGDDENRIYTDNYGDSDGSVYSSNRTIYNIDRTHKASAGEDQFLAFHFPALPVVGSAPSGGVRLDVTYHEVYAGAMTSVLPASATTTSIGMYPPNDTDPGSKTVKVWQVLVRAPNTNVNQQWLTVFDLSTTAAKVAVASRIAVTSGAAVGTLLASSSGNNAVIVNSGAAGTTIAGNIAYSVPAVATTHVITELPANKGYTVSVALAAGKHLINVMPGGSFKTSAKGVLTFTIAANGAASSSAAVHQGRSE